MIDLDVSILRKRKCLLLPTVKRFVILGNLGLQGSSKPRNASPVYKKDDETSKTDYRPVSVLSTIPKEKLRVIARKNQRNRSQTKKTISLGILCQFDGLGK